MPKGRPRKSRELLQLQGTLQPCRDRPGYTDGPNVPEGKLGQYCQTPGLVQAPKRARDIYWRTCRKLSRQGMMDPSFCPEILIWAIDQDLAGQCVKSLKADGLTLKGTTKNGDEIVFPNPAFKQLMQLQDKLLKIGGNFGMSPAERSRLKLPNLDEKPKGLQAVIALIQPDDESSPDEQ